MLELGPDARATTSRSAARAQPGVDVLVTVGPLAEAMADRFDGESTPSPTRARRRRCCRSCWQPGDAVLVKASRALASRSCVRRCRREWHDLASVMAAVRVTTGSSRAGADRRHRLAADQRVPGPEVHRVPAPPLVRPEHPRGGTPGSPHQGWHPDDGRDHHLPRCLGAVPDPVHARLAVARRVRGAVACALLGFADDFTKIVSRRSLGLRARTKLIVTIAISLGLWWVATQKAGVSSTVRLRLVDVSVDLGPLFPLFIYLVVAGTTSAVNLTDGLDGLAAGCAAIVLLAYIGITFITDGQRDLTFLAACVVGACIGFLWFNSFPASIFMGDTGSLGLGGAIAGLAIMTNTEVLLILLGGIFVIEALSVLIQVFSFQTFRKRVFLMAPIHHHFELQGWSETKIILRFWIVAAAFCAIGFTLYQLSIRG